MIRYSLPAQTPPTPEQPRAVALGIFDGVHSGHQAVVTAAVTAGAGKCAVYTFAPDTVTTKGDGQQRLCTAEEQEQLLARLGVEELFEVDFATVCRLSPEQFVEKVLVEQLRTGTVTCGYNYRFGRGGSGDAALLTVLCAAHGITVQVLPAVESAGQPVSSTAIRGAIARGELSRARQLLGRGYSLRLPVSHGQQLGRRLGMPTVNQALPRELALPPFGVYASTVEVRGEVYTGVTNIGVRPTVGGEQPIAETWIHGFSGDLYDETVTVYPVAFLRGEQKFPTVEALGEQVRRDEAAALAMFAPKKGIRAVLFDFDDTFALRSPAFARALKKTLAWLYPSADEAVLQMRHDEMVRFNNYGYGMPCTYREFFARFAAKWPPEIAVSIEAINARFFMDFAGSCRLCADVLPGIQALRQQGVLVGAITNGESRLQNAKLTLSGVRSHLDIAVVGGDEDVQKPDPGIFQRVAGRLGLSPQNCLYVGDNPTNDIYGALGAGMRAVWIDRGLEPDNPCYSRPIPEDVPTVHDLHELAQWLEKQ